MNRMLVALLMLVGISADLAAFDFLTARGTGLGQAILLSDQTPSELLSMPTGALDRGEFRFESAVNRSFDLSDLDQFMLAGAGRKGRYSLAVGFAQFGKSELYTEQTAKLTVAAQFDSLTIAIGGSYRILGFGGTYENLSSATIHASTAYRYKQVIASVGGDNLSSPSFDDGSPVTRPLYTSTLEYVTSRRLSVLGRVQLQEMERPRFSIGQYIGLGKSAALMLGVVTAPTQLGGGIEFNLKGGRLTYGASVHPVLGLSQTIAVSFGNRHSSGGSDDEFK